MTALPSGPAGMAAWAVALGFTHRHGARALRRLVRAREEELGVHVALRSGTGPKARLALTTAIVAQHFPGLLPPASLSSLADAATTALVRSMDDLRDQVEEIADRLAG